MAHLPAYQGAMYEMYVYNITQRTGNIHQFIGMSESGEACKAALKQ
jgi:hypothetical protein